MCLDVAGAKLFDGAKLQIWNCNGLATQSFTWCTDHRIVSDANADMCLEVQGGDLSKPGSLQMSRCDKSASQYWGYDSQNMVVYPSNTQEKMCMDLHEGSPAAGTPVVIF